MSYQALYRKWRPLVFNDIVEQEYVVKILRNSIISARIAHAYLFCGTRGTGKTTMAQIFSRAVNCLNPEEGDPCNKCVICTGILSGSIMDVIEIDAASNNSVENVRNLREEVIYTPSQAKFKVYIIDEVHMLSTGAFNALLKTLEEPPSHVIFVLATTEPHKLPATILSRCQRFDFKRITIESIVKRLEVIAFDSGVEISTEAAKLIARVSDGALRDAISILDQCMSAGGVKISYENVLSVIGIVNDSFLADVADTLIKKNTASIFGLVERLVMDGKDISQFLADLILYYRNLLVCKITEKPGDIIEAGRNNLQRMIGQSAFYNCSELSSIIKELSSFESSLKWAVHPRILLEVALIKICEGGTDAREAVYKPADKVVGPDNGQAGSIAGNTAVEDVPAREGSAVKSMNPGTLDSKTDVVETANPGLHTRIVKTANPEPLPGMTKTTNPESYDGTTKTTNLAPYSGELKIWDSVLKELNSSGKRALCMYLTDTKAFIDENKTVAIVFNASNSMGKMMVQKSENMELINEILNKKLNYAVTLKLLVESDAEAREINKKSAGSGNAIVDKIRSRAPNLDIPFNVIDE